ncbi:hypothetical protein GGF46_000780 [Coemansia sp. RSA 552]|nr:hypothetical protein GGF46_000780 [Coemansia sp. RSA 552]
MVLDQLRKEIADGNRGLSNGSTEAGAHPPIGGRYIALFRRTAAGLLFSDPVYVAHGQNLPDLPDGVQYIAVHPYAGASKPQTMERFLPAAARTGARDATEYHPVKATALPEVHDWGQFSSFFPTRDSSLTSFSAADYSALSTTHTSHLVSDSSVGQEDMSEESLEAAVALADQIVSSTALPDGQGLPSTEDISPETLCSLGLTYDDLGIPEPDAPETAASILKENSLLLRRLLEMQDRRAAAGDLATISEEEQQVAHKLQLNMARAVLGTKPSALRPPTEEIQRAAQLLVATSADSEGSYAGTLPPQRRFAFMSNAAAAGGVPNSATAQPMQRPPAPLQK